MNKGLKKIAATIIATLVAITLLLPNYNTTVVSAKTVRDINSNYVEIDTDNLAYADAEEDEGEGEDISYSDLVKRDNANSKGWVKNGKKYLPFTDSYLSTTKYETFLKKVNTQKTIKTKKAGKLSTKNLKLTANLNNDKISIKISNTGKKRLTDVRLYCFQDEGTMRIFVDSAENQIAYTELRTAECVTVKSAEMNIKKIGLENISAQSLISTNGEYIGADGNGKIAAGETVTVTLKVTLTTSLPMPAPESN